MSKQSDRDTSFIQNSNDSESSQAVAPMEERMSTFDVGWGEKGDVESRRSVLPIKPGHEPIYEDTPFLCCNRRFSKELGSWYLYDWASSAFWGFGMTFLIPLFLASIAEVKANEGKSIPICEGAKGETNGATYDVNCFTDGDDYKRWFCSQGNNILSDHKDACTKCIPGKGNVFWSGVKAEGFNLDPVKTVPFLFTDVNYVTYVTWIISFSIIFQAFVFVIFGPYADSGGLRKRMFTFTIIGGAISVMLFYFAAGEQAYLLGSIIVVIANVLGGFSVVLYNSYMPILAAAHPRIALAYAHPTNEESNELAAFYDRHESNVSMLGFTTGYVGSLLAMGIVMVVISFGANEVANGFFSYRISCLIVGTWWLVFSIPCIIYLKTRPGPPLSESAPTLVCKIFYGWIHTYRSICYCFKFKDAAIFLCIYGLYIDMVNTITYVGILFGKEELCMGQIELVILALANVGGCIIGGIGFMILQSLFQLTTKTIILICLFSYTLCTVYGVTGVFQNVIGIHQHWEFYIFAFILGCLTGVIQSNSRALFAEFIPVGKESMFFSIYQLTEKLTSWMGPLITGAISAVPQLNKRWAFFYFTIMAMGPALLLYFFVNVRRGMVAAGRIPASEEETQETKK